jgi:hypothetical protein
MDRPGARVGVLVVRIWTEPGSVSGLRARITWTVDVAASEEVVRTAASVAEIDTQFHAWLDAFQARWAGGRLNHR